MLRRLRMLRVSLVSLLALLPPLLAGCASLNRYDHLSAVSLEQVPMRPAANDRPRMGIAFGGGGVRGFMHLGAMRALDEAGIRADIVTGSSVGAMAAVLYASGLPYREIEARVLRLSALSLADPVFSRRGFVNGKELAATARELAGWQQMHELPVTAGIAVTDLDQGVARLVIDGDIGEAVQASASVPGSVIPVESKGMTLVDGGVLALVPVRFARALGADVVLAIDIYCGNAARPKGHAIDTMLRTLRLQSCRLSAAEAAEADFLVRPDFEPENPSSFAQRHEAIEAGYLAMLPVLPGLKARLGLP